MVTMGEEHDHDHLSSDENGSGGIDAATIDRAFAPRPRSGLVGVEIDGETVLIEEETGSVRHLDAIGSIVWDSFDGVSTIDRIASELAAEFRADTEVVRDDVLALAQNLGGQGLLEGVARDLPPQMQQPMGFPAGTALPGFTLETLDGGTFDLEAEHGRRLLLVHWSPQCGYCDRIAPDLIELQPHLEREDIGLVLLSIGTREANEEKLSTLGLSSRLVLKEAIDPETDPFRGQGTPAAYLIDADGRTASELASGANEVPVLIRDTVGVEAPVVVEEPEPEEPVAPVEEGRSQPKFMIEPKSS